MAMRRSRTCARAIDYTAVAAVLACKMPLAMTSLAWLTHTHPCPPVSPCLCLPAAPTVAPVLPSRWTGACRTTRSSRSSTPPRQVQRQRATSASRWHQTQQPALSCASQGWLCPVILAPCQLHALGRRSTWPGCWARSGLHEQVLAAAGSLALLGR